MKKPNVLLGLTGSVATVLAPKIVKGFQKVGNVKVVMTKPAQQFYNSMKLHCETEVDVFTEEHEWNFTEHNSVEYNPEYERTGFLREHLDTPQSAHGWPNYDWGKQYKKDDAVLHIELRKWADVLVIAPLSANTLAKMANGLCDNLLTSVLTYSPR